MPSDFEGLRSAKRSSKVEWFWMDGLSVCSFWFSIVLGCLCLFCFDCVVAFWNLAVWRSRHLKACWTSRCVKMRINLPLLGTGRRIRPGWWIEEGNIWEIRQYPFFHGPWPPYPGWHGDKPGLCHPKWPQQGGPIGKHGKERNDEDEQHSSAGWCPICHICLQYSMEDLLQCVKNDGDKLLEVKSNPRNSKFRNEVKQMDAKGTFMNLIKSVYT